MICLSDLNNGPSILAYKNTVHKSIAFETQIPVASGENKNSVFLRSLIPFQDPRPQGPGAGVTFTRFPFNQTCFTHI